MDEEREPEFMTYEKEPEVIEKKEQTGRTLFSGERRITNESSRKNSSKRSN